MLSRIIILATLLGAASYCSALSNITLPNIPSTEFHRIDNPFERLQRDSYSHPYSITAEGSGILQVTATTNLPVPCGDDPQGEKNTSCLENTENANQKIYIQIAYKPCGFNPSIPLTKNNQSSVSIQLPADEFNPAACNQVPGTTNGSLTMTRIPFLRTQNPPISGLYNGDVTLTVSEA